MDPLMLYGIALHKYYNEIPDMMQTAIELQQDTGVFLSNTIPPIPPIPEVTRMHAKNNLNFIPKTFT